MKDKWNNIEDNLVEEIVKSLPEEQKEIVRMFMKNSKLLNSKSARYTLKWMYECLLIRIKSPKTYEHLRNHKLLPLPCAKTLQKYLSAMDSAYGFNTTLFEMLKVKSKEMHECERRGMTNKYLESRNNLHAI